MTIDDRIATLDCFTVNASPHSNWMFVRASTAGGIVGHGEATYNGLEGQISQTVERLADLARHERPDVGLLMGRCLANGNEPAVATALSAVDQALWDVKSKLAGVPLQQSISTSFVREVSLYANINRSLSGSRSPESFAVMAANAADAGFRAIKIAPFDGVNGSPRSDGEVRRAYHEGLDRVESVGSAIPNGTALMVDCHWRFDASFVTRLVRDLTQLDVVWIEGPVPESRPDLWSRNWRSDGVVIAGGEMYREAAQFEALIKTQAVDVIMPDVKYCGGISGLITAFKLASESGVAVAPHNPSGPVGTLASAHVSAAYDEHLWALEYPWGECPWRSRLVRGAETLSGAKLILGEAPGTGCEIDDDLVKAHPFAEVKLTADLSRA